MADFVEENEGVREMVGDMGVGVEGEWPVWGWGRGSGVGVGKVCGVLGAGRPSRGDLVVISW